MGLFSFIETFFFVSLGITFILILLLVYHFRQRFVALEQKCDTMFDLINNIVTELNNERRSAHGFGITEPHIMFSPEPNGELSNVVDDERTQTNMEEFRAMNDSDSDEDSDEDSEDDSEDDSQDDDYGDITSFEIVDDNSVKVIVLDQLDELTELPTDTAEQSENEELVELDLDAIDQVVVEKLDPTKLDHILEETPLEKQSTDVYNKMPIQALKALVITKGLSSEPSKMKKAELLKLLETAGQ